jgi:hypothetical protein
MRTAIILVGNMRSWVDCRESFKKTFEKANPDVFVSTYDVQYGHHPHIQGVISDNTDVMLTPKEIVDMLQGFNVKTLLIDNFIKLCEVDWKYHEKYSHLGRNCFTPIYKLKRGLEMMEEFENKNNFKYDIVIKTRPDVIYTDPCPLDFEIEEFGKVTIDSGNVFPSDVILATDRQAMINMVDFMLSEFFEPLYPDSELNPPHNFYLNAMKHFGMKVVGLKIMDHIIRKTGYKHYY